MRIILYTGKGGVGKTSIAAASACKLAMDGKNVLIMSTDQAHSLGDSFEMKIGNEETKIAEHLYGMEIDAEKESEIVWGQMQGYLKQILTLRANDGLETEEVLVFPGLEELFSMLKILDIKERNKYDVLILDCAPTGETMSLLRFPEMFGNLIRQVLPVERKLIKFAGPVVSKITQVPMPNDSVFDELTALTSRLEQMQILMQDKEQVSIRIVTTPERIVIKEAKRNFTWLHMYNYNVDAIIVNRIYPHAALEGYFCKWIELQKNGLKEIEESFYPIPIYQLELKKKELKSFSFLCETAKELFKEIDLANVLFKKKIFELIQEDGKDCFQIYLPFTEKADLELLQEGEEIILRIQNMIRRIILPDSIRRKEVESAKYENGILKLWMI